MHDKNKALKRRDVLKTSGTSLAGLSALPFVLSDEGDAKSSKSEDHPSPVTTLPPKYRPSSQNVTVIQPAGSKNREIAQQLGLKMVLLVPSEKGSKQPLFLGRDGAAADFTIRIDAESKKYEIENPRSIDSTSNELNPEATSYYGPFTMVVTTHDPAECRLARTKQTLEWAYDSNYDTTYVTDRSMFTRAWAPVDHCEGGVAHFVNTHWYEDWSRFTGRGDGSNSCYTECEAQFYNDDYQDNNHRTYSWHQLHITGYESGTKDWWGTADHWGEGSSNLHIHVRKG